jgi:cytochrome c2
MALRPPGSLVLTFGLLAAGGLAGAGSLGVQRWQTQQQAEQAARQLTGGDPEHGKSAFKRFRCGGCHAIRQVDGADGQVGPALDKIAGRAFLAGDQPNDPAHMVAWLQHPQALRPGTGMPELGLADQDARDVAAYLYTLR